MAILEVFMLSRCATVFAFLVFLSALFTSVSAKASSVKSQRYAFYEGQPITQVTHNSSAQLQSYAGMVVGFIFPDRISWKNERAHFTQIPLQQEYRMCPNEELANAPSSFFCSGVFIDQNRILTAGHCVAQMRCSEFIMLRNAQSYNFQFGVSKSDVFTCKKIQRLNAFDLAIVHTQETTKGPFPAIQKKQSQQVQHKIFMVGHPLGLPLYFSQGQVRNVGADRYLAQMSAFEGNSGAPVFAQETGHLIGLLVQGENDFFKDEINKCNRMTRCQAGQCKGETITKVYSELIPSQLTP